MIRQPTSGIRRVTLSVRGHVYTCEVWRESDNDWTLLRVEVHGLGVAGALDQKASSCLEVLQRGELAALEIISASPLSVEDSLIFAAKKRVGPKRRL